MKEDDVILDVIRRLEALGLEHMLVGSYASNAWGRPRSSFDADIVVRISPDDAGRFHDAFADDYLVSIESLRRDLDAGAMFNLIPQSGVFKVDIIPVRKTPHAREEFGRRRRIRVLGRDLWVASPEDTILSKLVWHRKGGEVSGRQMEDARDVWATQREVLDRAYMDRWAAELGVGDLLDRIRVSAEGR